jgi:hypothetical protein
MTLNASATLFRPPSHPYIIYATPYSETSSGVKATHLLCHALNRSGHEAYVMTGPTDPWLWTPTIYLLRREIFRIAGRLPIVVYPDTVTDNPLEASVVVRWLLNKPGAFVDNWRGFFPPSDMVFHYDEDFLIDGLTGTPLHLPTCDPRIYNNVDNPFDNRREGHLLYLVRYRQTGEPVADFLANATVISSDNPRTPKELAELYRRSEFLFSYERTAATLEAALCGCPVVFLESPLLSAIPAQKSFGTDGFAWGFTPEETERAKRTVHVPWQIYQKQLADFDIQLAGFIAATQARAAEAAAKTVTPPAK